MANIDNIINQLKNINFDDITPSNVVKAIPKSYHTLNIYVATKKAGDKPILTGEQLNLLCVKGLYEKFSSLDNGKNMELRFYHLHSPDGKAKLLKQEEIIMANDILLELQPIVEKIHKFFLKKKKKLIRLMKNGSIIITTLQLISLVIKS